MTDEELRQTINSQIEDMFDSLKLRIKDLEYSVKSEIANLNGRLDRMDEHIDEIEVGAEALARFVHRLQK